MYVGDVAPSEREIEQRVFACHALFRESLARFTSAEDRSALRAFHVQFLAGFLATVEADTPLVQPLFFCVKEWFLLAGTYP